MAARLPSISFRTAERLVARAPVAREHDRVARLLSAAAGPPRPHELAGHEGLLDAFVEAGRDRVAAPVRPPRLPLATLSRALAAKVTAVLAAVFVGSAALAAQTGHLPARAQRTAHDLFSSWGVPAPAGGGATPGGTPVSAGRPPSGAAAGARDPAGPGGVGGVGGVGGPGAPPTRPPAGDLAVLQRYCRIFLDHHRDPGGVPLDAQALRALAVAAHGESNIPAYCASLIGTGPAPTRAATPAPSARGTPPPRTGQNGSDNGPRPAPGRSPAPSGRPSR